MGSEVSMRQYKLFESQTDTRLYERVLEYIEWLSKFKSLTDTEKFNDLVDHVKFLKKIQYLREETKDCPMLPESSNE